MLHTVLLGLALLLFFAAVFNPPVKVNLVAAGLACWVATLLV